MMRMKNKTYKMKTWCVANSKNTQFVTASIES